MGYLKKYHKQDYSKETYQALKEVNRSMSLKYNLKNRRDLLRAMVVATGLHNKKILETEYEAVRNQYFDMWEHLQYTERNKIARKDMTKIRGKLPSFKTEKAPHVYIPFFNELLNSLYDKEIAVLDLPQFFKLTEQFTDDMIDIDSYGLGPYRGSMTYGRYVVGEDDKVVLYDKNINMFFVVDEETCQEYPLLMGEKLSKEQIQILGESLYQNDEKTFVDTILEGELVAKKCQKKLASLRRKNKEIVL